MTLHYHGTPITPKARIQELAGVCFCVSFARDQDIKICHEIGQSVMLDNGAFSFWRAGKGQVDLDQYAQWVAPWLEYRTTWCIIPDVIDGSELDNDMLICRWSTLGLPIEQCAPVWHMHEPIERLHWLCDLYPRVCIGSSAQYAKVGNKLWHGRMSTVMDSLCGEGPPPVWLHMLRGLSLAGSAYPFASVDSTNIGRNAGNNGRSQSARRMADDFDARQCPARWLPGSTTT